jgi:molecular chaperone DnaK
VHSTEKSRAEFGSQVSEADRAAIEYGISDLKEALNGDDAEAIKAKTQTLAQASMKLGEAMYAAQQSGADGGGDSPDGGSTGESKEDVVDAEFTEVDDDKKKSA